MRIGEHVSEAGGGWREVVTLAREAVAKSFAGVPYDQVEQQWRTQEADAGIRLAFDRWYGPPNEEGFALGARGVTYGSFAEDFDRSYAFRTSPTGPIALDGGRLFVNPIATTSPRHWRDHPIVDGVEIAIEASAYPDESWAAGEGFVYEPGNWAVRYYRSQYRGEPPVGFGGDPHAVEPIPPERPQRYPPTRPKGEERMDAGPATGGASRESRSSPAAPAGFPGQALLTAPDSEGALLLTVPGGTMSMAQREALMGLPAFSDESDPLFGPAVWKYRDANVHGAARAVAAGAIDIVGRPARPAFADTDGAPADADGRPMAEALADVGRSLDKAARALGPEAAVAALQGAVNDIGEDQVRAQSPREGAQANRLLPRLAVDGVAGPRTAEAVRLALHHAGGPRLDEALATRLGRMSRPRALAQTGLGAGGPRLDEALRQRLGPAPGVPTMA